MKKTLLALALAPALLSTPALAETSPGARAWMAETAEQIGREAGLKPGDQPVTVRLDLGGARRFDKVQLVSGSGSTTQDAAVLGAAKRLRHDLPPIELRDRRVVLQIAPALTAQASGPAQAR